METWKALDRNQNYEVSSDGRVRERARPVFNRGRVYSKPPRQIEPFIDPDGYAFVVIRKPLGTGSEKIFVHRLVMEVFISKCPDDMTVDHIDRVRTNNAVSNLRYATKAEQTENRDLSRISGENSKFSKLKEADVEEIREMICSGSPDNIIAKKFSVSISAIRNIRLGKSWKVINDIK
jgi:muconolactone delta-isomerase